MAAPAGSDDRAIVGFSLLYAAMFMMATGNLAMMSLFPAIARSSRIPDVAMVTVQSLSAALSIVATPWWASRSDRVGRKPIILVGIAGFTIASALTAGAIFSAVHGLVPVVAAVVALAASRAVFGCIGLAAGPAIQAHIADETTPAQRTRAMTSIHSAQGLGSVVGPGIAPFLILPVLGLAGPQLIFAAVGAAMLAVLAWRLPKKPPRASRSAQPPTPKWAVFRRRTVRPFVIYLAVLSGCQAANLQMLGFVVIDRTGLAPIDAQSRAGLAIMLGAAAAVTIQLGILRRIRVRPSQLMVCGLVVVVAGNLLMAFAADYVLVVLAFVLSSAGYAVGVPGTAAGASLANSGEDQGAVAGLISAAGSSGLLIAPVVAMIVYRYYPPAAFLAIAAALCVSLAIVAPRCIAALRQPLHAGAEH